MRLLVTEFQCIVSNGTYVYVRAVAQFDTAGKMKLPFIFHSRTHTGLPILLLFLLLLWFLKIHNSVVHVNAQLRFSASNVL